MKDMTKIFQRALTKVPAQVETAGAKDLQELLVRVINHPEADGVDAFVKKYGVYESEFLKATYPEAYALVEADVIKRKAKAEARKGKLHHHTVKAIEKKLTIESDLKKYREEVKAYNEANKDVPGFKERKVLVGYARVSTKHQNLGRQLKALNEYGCGIIFEEKVSGKDTERVVFKHMMSLLEPGDVIVVSDLTRLARSTYHLTGLMQQFDETGIALQSIKESWIDTTSSQGRLMFTIMSGLAQFERELMLERQAEGIEVAKSNGVKFGKQLSEDANLERAIEMYCNNLDNYTVTKIAELNNISRTTLWRKLRDRNLLRK